MYDTLNTSRYVSMSTSKNHLCRRQIHTGFTVDVHTNFWGTAAVPAHLTAVLMMAAILQLLASMNGATLDFCSLILHVRLDGSEKNPTSF